MAQTLFSKYGGFGSVSRIVLTFYDKVLDSEQIGDYFDSVDMKRLVDHQTRFVASLMGGPADFADARLGQLHKHLNISDIDFNEMSDLLGEALAEHGVSAEDRDAIRAEIEARRSVIVSG